MEKIHALFAGVIALFLSIIGGSSTSTQINSPAPQIATTGVVDSVSGKQKPYALIFFRNNQTGQEKTVFTVDETGKTLEKIETEKLNDSQAVMSLNKKLIAYKEERDFINDPSREMDTPQKEALILYQYDTSKRQDVTVVGSIYTDNSEQLDTFLFSPSGSYLLYVTHKDTKQGNQGKYSLQYTLHIVDTNTFSSSTLVTLLQKNTYEEQFSPQVFWSTDSSSVIFTDGDTIKVVKVDGSQERVLIKSLGWRAASDSEMSPADMDGPGYKVPNVSLYGVYDTQVLYSTSENKIKGVDFSTGKIAEIAGDHDLNGSIMGMVANRYLILYARESGQDPLKASVSLFDLKTKQVKTVFNTDDLPNNEFQGFSDESDAFYILKRKTNKGLIVSETLLKYNSFTKNEIPFKVENQNYFGASLHH